MEKNSLSIPTSDWLNRYKNTYAYIYIKRIIIMEMNGSWVPKFDWQNWESIHMHTYILR